jgi:hypothetical protein
MIDVASTDTHTEAIFYRPSQFSRRYFRLFPTGGQQPHQHVAHDFVRMTPSPLFEYLLTV